MGYYTHYSLEAHNIQGENQFNELLECLKEKELIYYAFDNGNFNPESDSASFPSWEEVKWYDYHEHMTEIANKFPNIYFELEGHGEEYDDIWKEYYLGNFHSVSFAKILFDYPENWLGS